MFELHLPTEEPHQQLEEGAAGSHLSERTSPDVGANSHGIGAKSVRDEGEVTVSQPVSMRARTQSGGGSLGEN